MVFKFMGSKNNQVISDDTLKISFFRPQILLWVYLKWLIAEYVEYVTCCKSLIMLNAVEIDLIKCAEFENVNWQKWSKFLKLYVQFYDHLR